MKKVRAKKHLGQHFLKEVAIAERTVDAFNRENSFSKCIEIGPGMGVLTQYLLKRHELELYLVELDMESVTYLQQQAIVKEDHLIHGDFLKMNLNQWFGEDSFGIIGNFPYNISSQILFKLLDYKNQARELVGMFQKEVAERVVSPPGSKVYGITSVLVQAYYDVEYLFTVDEDCFDPPPKVKSAVIRLRRNKTTALPCNEKAFRSIVKMAFNQRRKTLRNSLKSIIPDALRSDDRFNARPEQLSVKHFIELTQLIHPQEG